MPATNFIRNNDYEIIGRKKIMCIQKYNELIEMYNRKLIAMEEIEAKLNQASYGALPKQTKEKIENEKNEIIKKITELNDVYVYDHFTEFDFHAPVGDKLLYVPVANEKQLRKQKAMKKALSFHRNAKKDTIMITLGEE